MLSTWRWGPAPSMQRFQSSPWAVKPSKARRGDSHLPPKTKKFVRKFADSQSEATEDEELAALTRAVQQSSRPSSNSVISHGNSDPFLSTAIPLTAIHSDLISAWQPLFFDVVWPDPPGPGLVVDRRPAMLAWARQCSLTITNEAAMNGMLAMSVMIRAADSMDPVDKARRLSQGLYYKGGTVKALKRFLTMPTRSQNDSSNEAAICAAYCLTCLNFVDGSIEEARVHLKGIKSMIDTNSGMQGVNSLTWAIKCQVVTVDLSAAQVCLQKPIFDAADWDPGSYLERLTTDQRESLERRGALVRMGVDDLYSHETKSIFRAYYELIAIHALSARLDDIPTRTKMLLWAHLRKYALVGRILDLRLKWYEERDPLVTQGLISAATARASLDLCACIAIRYCQQIVFNAAIGTITVYADFADFQRILSVPEICQHASSGFLLWIFAVSSIIEETLSRSVDSSRWHLWRFHGLTQVMGCDNVEAIARIIGRYLYVADGMQHFLKVLLARGRALLADPQAQQNAVIKHSNTYLYEGKGEWFRRNTSQLVRSEALVLEVRSSKK